MSEYHKANLHWLLKLVKRHLPELDTGDWFKELLELTETDAEPNRCEHYGDNIMASLVKVEK